MAKMTPVKCVIVGDGNVGKTCMVASFAENKFPDQYVPTVFNNHTMYLNIDKRVINLAVWDTAGQEDYDRLRPLAYPLTDVFIVCFSLTSRTSFENVKQKWYPEVSHHCPDTPIILVGTKLDMRPSKAQEDSHSDMIIRSQGRQLAQKIKAAAYLECSAKTQIGLREAFNEAIKAVLMPEMSNTKRQRRSFRCSLI